jgi:hypothetical protein
MRIVPMLLIMALGISFPMYADVFLKHKTHTDAMEMMGQKVPEKDVISTIWMAGDKVRSDMEEQSVILRLDKNVQYVLNHQEKTYMEIPLNFAEQAYEAAKEEAGDDAGTMENMMKSMMQMKITITETQETQTIRNWKCRKYLQTIETAMGPMQSVVWATEDIKIDYDVYTKFMASSLAKIPAMGEMVSKMQEEMKKIKGIPVLTQVEMSMMGQTIKSSTELIEYKTGTAPSGTFDIPKGYTKTDTPAMPGMGG